jgi:hypothetical protein
LVGDDEEERRVIECCCKKSEAEYKYGSLVQQKSRSISSIGSICSIGSTRPLGVGFICV